MKKYLIMIEYAAGTDKGCDGFRPDTKPIMKAMKDIAGYDSEVVFYTHERRDELFDYIKDRATVVITRINPGNLKEVDDFFQFLNGLSEEGINTFTHPDVMINLDFKDMLEKLKDTPIGDQGSKFYHTMGELKEKLPAILERERIHVLKTNYGSTGEGVYLVSLNDNGTIVSKEAVNNEEEHYADIDDFIVRFADKFEEDAPDAKYFKGKTGFVGCRYLKRIAEGEIRVLLVGDKPASIVHKKPQEGEFSATLFSGAQYKYESPSDPKWAEVVRLTVDALEDVRPHLSGHEFPLLWTMDYILDYDKGGNDIHVLSEINCSCVGITTQMELADEVARIFV